MMRQGWIFYGWHGRNRGRGQFKRAPASARERIPVRKRLGNVIKVVQMVVDKDVEIIKIE